MTSGDRVSPPAAAASAAHAPSWRVPAVPGLTVRALFARALYWLPVKALVARGDETALADIDIETFFDRCRRIRARTPAGGI